MTPSLAMVAASALAVLVLLVRAAYRRGWRDGSRSLPDAVVAELADHKLRCLGEPAPRVEIELACLFGRPHSCRARGATGGPAGDGAS